MNKTYFPNILLVVTLSIACCAAYFSIYGIANIFSAVFWSAVVMGATLEAGKLVTVSFLFQEWHETQLWLKSILLVSVFGLMVITSVGIYGYLMAAYQVDNIGRQDNDTSIALLEQEKIELDERVAAINADVARISAGVVTKRMELMDKYQPEKVVIDQRVRLIRTEIAELSKARIIIEAHTGPIIYIAKQIGKSVDDAVHYMILLIIFVFDPLAVALTVGFNQIVVRRRLVAEQLEQEKEESMLVTQAKTIEGLNATVAKLKDAIANLKHKLGAQTKL